tara:strand:- start:2403 stop:2660 length:258 start_codon:yes stop_codon:yes gene_type:complete
MSNVRLSLKMSVLISLLVLIFVLLCVVYAQYTAAVVLIVLLLFLLAFFGYYAFKKPQDDNKVVFIPSSKIKIMGYELKEVKQNHK